MITHKEVLDSFLFGDADNNRNFFEGTHDITFEGNHFAVRERATGVIKTFCVSIGPSNLPQKEWKRIFTEQEWNE